MVPAS